MRGLIYPVGVGEAFAHAVASKQLDSFSTGIDRRGDCYRDSMGRLHVRNAWLTEVSVVDEPAMPPAKITSARWVTDAGFFERLRAA
jgi:phage head maturation protease